MHAKLSMRKLQLLMRLARSAIEPHHGVEERNLHDTQPCHAVEAHMLLLINVILL